MALAPVHVRGLRCIVFCCVRSCTCTSACLELALVSLYSQGSSVVHMHVDPSCIHCSTILPSTIAAGLFPPHPPLFSNVYIINYQCDGCPCSLLRGGSWLGCQDLPAMGAVSSRSWLPKVEAAGCLGLSTPI